MGVVTFNTETAGWYTKFTKSCSLADASPIGHFLLQQIKHALLLVNSVNEHVVC